MNNVIIDNYYKVLGFFIQVLKLELEEFYEKYQIDLQLLQPQLNPISILGKNDEDIIFELETNLELLFKLIDQDKILESNIKTLEKFLGTEWEDIKTTAKLRKISNSGWDNKKIFLLENIIIRYLLEFAVFDIEFNNHFNEFDSYQWDKSKSRRLSTFFRITAKDNISYYTIEDAIKVNLNTGFQLKN